MLSLRNVSNAGQLASSLVPIPGANVAAGAFTLIDTELDIREYTENGARMMGEDPRHLMTDSPAFKDYAQKLSGLYVDRMESLGAGLAGSAAATSLVAYSLGGPPGWILGTIAMIGGGMGGSWLKNKIRPNQLNQFVEFASTLQSKGQEGANYFQQTGQVSPADIGISAEQAFVALAMNSPDPTLLERVTKSLPKKLARKGLVKALESEEGLIALRDAMRIYDNDIRTGTGAMVAVNGLTASEEYAYLVNTGQMAGVNLLSVDRTMEIGTLISTKRDQQIQEQQMAAMGMQPGMPQRGRLDGAFAAMDRNNMPEDMGTQNPNANLPYPGVDPKAAKYFDRN